MSIHLIFSSSLPDSSSSSTLFFFFNFESAHRATFELKFPVQSGISSYDMLARLRYEPSLS
ncbi:hypothetical protein HanRHA438_Chr08g0347161 [Helianthus annuus]|nr:hypothetical protein HanRHA438_Chr08g0347161 [Helianthus annuus]